MPICHGCRGFYKPSERGQQICNDCKAKLLEELKSRVEKAEDSIQTKSLDKQNESDKIDSI